MLKLYALKIRLYPNESQTTFFNKNMGSARFIYNKMLEERNKVYEELKDDKEALKNYKYKTEFDYKHEFEWLKEVDSRALIQSARDLQTAYKNFF